MENFGELLTIVGGMTTIVGGAVGLLLNAQYQRMRREITKEISDSRHATIDRVINNISEVKLALEDKVGKDIYAQQIHALERRQDFVERLVSSRSGGQEHSGHS